MSTAHHGDHTPHESPLVMLIPLAVLALGALVAGFVFHDAFIGEGYDEFWKGAIFTRPDNHILEDMHHVAGLGAAAADPHDDRSASCSRVYMYIVDAKKPAELAADHPLLYRFLLNKWYFDELYDVALRPPGHAARPLPVADGRRADHRRPRP